MSGTVYVDIEELKKSLDASNTTYLDDQLELDAAAASELVDDICYRTFGLTEDDAGRVAGSDRAGEAAWGQPLDRRDRRGRRHHVAEIRDQHRGPEPGGRTFRPDVAQARSVVRLPELGEHDLAKEVPARIVP